MNRITLFASAALLVLAVGCTVEELQPEQREELQEITIQAVVADEDGLTKTVRLENGNIWWTPGDEISLFYGSGENGGSRFTSQNTENAQVTNFTGTIGVITGGADITPEQTYFWGVYPYNATASCNGTTIVTDVLTTQVATPGTFATGTYPWIGKSQGLVMAFYGLCGGIKFTVSKEGIKKVTLKSLDGSAIAGRVRVSVDANNIPHVEEVIDGSDEIVLEAPAGEYFIPGEPYFFVTLPHNFSESYFSVKFETFTEEGTYTRTRAAEIKRAIFLAFTSALDGNVTYTQKTGNIPLEDANFKVYLVANYDTNSDGEISYEEASAITEIETSTTDISSVQGIEYMINLEILNIGNYTSGVGFPANQKPVYYEPRGHVTVLDVSNNKSLLILDCHFNQLSSLDISNNEALNELDCGSNYISSLDVSNNLALTKLDCFDNYLLILDVSNNTTLINLRCDDNYLSSLDVSTNTVLERLVCLRNNLTSLNLPLCDSLLKLSCGWNQLTSLDVSYYSGLTSLTFSDNQLTTLDVSNNTVLESLVCDNNQLTTLDVSNNTALTLLSCNSNQLTTLILSNNTALTKLYCGDNQFTTLDVSNNTVLESLICDNNQLTTLILSNNTALTELYCGDNQFTTLDVSNNAALTHLDCSNNQLTSLDVSSNLALERLYCYDNQLTTLNVSSNAALMTLWCYNNQLTSLNVSHNDALADLRCSPMATLEDLYIYEGQQIPNVTADRSEDYIPAATHIFIAPGVGGGEGTGEQGAEP